jgi:hypothetical protein
MISNNDSEFQIDVAEEAASLNVAMVTSGTIQQRTAVQVI